MNEPVRKSPSRRRHHPVVNLVVARLREFLREPEAIFWVYVFPLVLVVALGVAFRNRPVETFRVAVKQGKLADGIATTLNRDPRFRATILDPEQCRMHLRTGRVDLALAVPDESPQRVDYDWDPARPRKRPGPQRRGRRPAAHGRGAATRWPPRTTRSTSRGDATSISSCRAWWGWA